MRFTFFAHMPYDSNDELPKDIKNALPAKAQIIYRKAFNSAYNSYDGDEKKAIATAWTAVKAKYVKKNDKWVFIETVESKVVSGGITFDQNAPVNEWIPVAKVGQEALLSPDNIIVTYDKEGLLSYANDTATVGVTYNHSPKRKLENVEIDKLKFEDPYLYMQISEQIKAAIKDPTVSGCSIEGIPKKIEDGFIKEVTGTYLSLMEFPQLPACKVGDGCGVVSSSVLEGLDVTSTVNTEAETNASSEAMVAREDASKAFDVFVMNNVGVTVKIGTDTVYGSKKQLKDKEFVKMELMQRGSYYSRDNLQFYDADTAIKIGDVIPNGSAPVHAMSVVISNQEQELGGSNNRHLERETENIEELSRGGDVKGMDKEEPITYTGEQVKEMVASAIGETETNLKNQQEVNIRELKENEGNAKAELERKHTTELKETAEQAYRKASAISTFKAKFNPSEEVLKQAEGLDPGAIEFFVGLNIPIAESPGGVSSGAPQSDEGMKEKYEDMKRRYNKKLGRRMGAE